jgi:hypothetical protein
VSVPQWLEPFFRLPAEVVRNQSRIIAVGKTNEHIAEPDVAWQGLREVGQPCCDTNKKPEPDLACECSRRSRPVFLPCRQYRYNDFCGPPFFLRKTNGRRPG